MKYLMLLAFLFAAPFVPGWLNRLQRISTRLQVKKAKIDEAMRILELAPGAGAEEIKAAHKRLIQKNHPDAGGSEYFASKINEARDLLLKNLKT